MNEEAITPPVKSSKSSSGVPEIVSNFKTIEFPSVPSRNASSPIDTSSAEVVSAAPTAPSVPFLFQGLLSLENARVSPI